MIVIIGEILVDIFPKYERIGGAPFNFAFHLKQLGFPVRFITRVGDDRNGHRIIEKLTVHGLGGSDVQVDASRPTGSVRVDLDEDGVPRFYIHENVAYDGLDLEREFPSGLDGGRLIYFGTLIQRTETGRIQVQDFLKRCVDGIPRFCDINMRPPHVNIRAVTESLEAVDLLKLNEEELADIGKAFDGPSRIDDAVVWLMDRFSIQAVALTRGSRGSRFYGVGSPIDCPAVSEPIIVDTVGAGDGFASILAAGYVKGVDWATTVNQASRFAARICAIPGAVPDDPSFYDDFQPLFQYR